MTDAVAAAQPLLSGHAVHLLTLAVPAVALAVFAAVADLRARTRSRERLPFTPNRALLTSAAAAGVVATAVHVSVAPEHFHEAVVFGVFFVATAACQLGWSALLLLRRRAWVVLAGGVGNATIVALWAYTRFVAVPIGPAAGRTEAAGVPDLVATGSEAAIVLLTVWILMKARSQRPAGCGTT